MNKEKQQRMIEYQFLLQRFKQMQEQLNELQNQINSVNAMKASLNEFENVKDETDGLFSIGQGLFVKGKFLGGEKTVVNVGAGVCVEKTFSDARVLIDNQLGEMVKLTSVIQNELKNITDEIVKFQESVSS